jgi:hypothetical protein
MVANKMVAYLLGPRADRITGRTDKILSAVPVPSCTVLVPFPATGSASQTSSIAVPVWKRAQDSEPDCRHWVGRYRSPLMPLGFSTVTRNYRFLSLSVLSTQMAW